MLAKRIPVLGFVFLLCIGGLFVLIDKRSGADSAVGPTNSIPNEIVPNAIDPGSSSFPRDVDQSINETASRRSADSVSNSFKVTGTTGEPISGVAISWRTVLKLPSGWQKAWKRSGLVGAGDPPLASTTSGVAGRYSPPQEDLTVPSSATGIAEWFLKSGWLGEVRQFDPSLSPEQWAEDIRLTPHAPVSVRVVDADGSPASAAEVILAGVSNPRVKARDAGTNRLLPLATQRGVTDAQGRVEFAALPGMIDVVARSENSVAVPFRGQCLPNIELTLQATFSISGTFSASENLSNQVTPRLQAEVRQDGSWTRLGALQLSQDQSWGPLALPVADDAEEFRLVVQGKPLTTKLIHFAPPAANEELFFNIQCEMGSRMLLRPIEAGTYDDPVQEVILGARARVIIQSDGQWFKNWYDADENGTIIITGLTSEPNYYSVFADGYQPSMPGRPPVPVEGEEPLYIVELTPSGVLAGTVLEENESGVSPAQDFEIVVWPLSAIGQKAVYSYSGTSDGQFEIKTPPLGDVSVSASTPTRPAGLPQIVQIEKGQEVDLEFRLTRGGLISGRVVDEASNLPVPSATVQLYTQGQTDPVSPWGSTHNVGPNGSFTLEGSVPRENFIFVEAEGYSSRYLSSYPSEDRNLDFGDILLAHQSLLTVRLLGLGERTDLDPENLRIDLDGATRTAAPVIRLEDGERGAIFPSINAGVYAIGLYTENGWERGIRTNISPSSENTVDLVLGGGSTVSIELEGGTPDQRKAASDIDAYPTDAFGNKVQMSQPINREGPTMFYGITQEQVTFLLYADDAISLLGSKRVDILPGQTTYAKLPFANRFFNVHVTDADGVPLPGTRVRLKYDASSQAEMARMTDSEGIAAFPDAPKDSLIVSLEHSQAGRQVGVEVDGRQDDVTLTLDARSELEVFVNDEGEAMPGVSVTLMADAAYQMTRNTTDATGKVLFQKLAPSSGLILISGANIWEELTPFESDEGKTFFQAPVWRTGTLSLSTSDPDGVPIPGAQIVLEHSATHRKLSDWIEANRVPRNCNRSDATGTALIPNIPHGQYRYVVTASGFVAASGTLNVTPGQLQSTSISLTQEE